MSSKPAFATSPDTAVPAHGYAAGRLTWWDHHRHVRGALHRGVQRRLEQLAAHGSARDQQVFDIGCGDRPYQPLVERQGWRYIGCDLDTGAEVLIEPGMPLPLADGVADGVVSFQVLEHVWDLDWYLGECRRLLKPGGWLLLSTHGVWPYHPHPTDFRRWTRDGLERELTERGFVVEGIDPLVGPLAWTTQIRLLGMREVLCRVPVLGPAVLVPLTCLMNLRMAVEDWITPAGIVANNACVYLTLSRVR